MNDPETDPARLPVSAHDVGELDRRLRALARTLVGDEALAEDVVQDAWVAALGRPRGAVHAVRSWMTGVVRNRAVEQVRYRRRSAELEQLFATREAVVAPSDSAAEAESVDVLGSAIRDLREPYSTTLRMRFFDVMEISEIAAATGRPESTVRSHLSRGVAELRRRLDEKHGERAAWRLALLPLARPGKRAAAAATSTSSRVVVWALGLVLLLGLGAVGWRLLRTGPIGADEGLAAVEPRAIEVDGATDAAQPVPPAVDAGRTPAVTETATDEPVDSVPVPTPSARQPVATLRMEVLHADGIPALRPRVAIRAQQQYERGQTFESNPFELELFAEDVHEAADGLRVVLSVASEEEAWSKATVISIDALEGPVRLSTRGPQATLEVRVQDEEGEKIVGARITLKPVGSQGREPIAKGVSQTDVGWLLATHEDGYVRFTEEPRQPRQVEVRALGYLPLDQPYEIDEENEVLTVTLVRGGTLSGHVRRRDGSPVAGARVRVIGVISANIHREEIETRTDDDGAYVLAGFGGAKQHVFAEFDRDGDVPLVDSTIVAIESGGEEAHDFRVEPHHGIRVRLEDPAHRPHVGMTAILFVPNDGNRTPPFAALLESDEEGIAHFPLVPDVRLGLMAVRGEGDVPNLAQDLTAAADPDITHTIVVPPAPGSGARLTGRLMEASGEPVVGAQVRLDRSGEFVHVDVDPTSALYEAVDLFEGSYAVLALIPGRGIVDLGRHVVAAGQAVDLGEKRLGAPIEVAFEWSADSPTETEPWAISAGDDDFEGRLIPVMVLRTAKRSVQLLPGNYILSRPSDRREWSFEVSAEIGPIELVLK